jgi:hypothetical protein
MIIEDAPEPDVGLALGTEDRQTPCERDLATVLRESLEDVEAGRVVPARQVLKDMAQRLNLPLEPGE